jgi:hypothetical protein
MSDNLSAGIARAKRLETELASKPRGCEYLGGAEQCMSIWEPEVPPRVYVAWGEHGPRFWSTTPPADMAVTTYVVQAEIDVVTEDRDLWHQSEETCERQFAKVQAELGEVLDQMQRLLGVVKAAQSIMADWITPQSETTNGDALHALLGILDNQDDDRVDDAAQAILTKHGRWT